MNLDLILNVSQIILAILLIIVILIQSQGSGLGSAFGGGGNAYRTKRGAEKKMHQITIIISILFFGIALTNVLI